MFGVVFMDTVFEFLVTIKYLFNELVPGTTILADIYTAVVLDHYLIQLVKEFNASTIIRDIQGKTDSFTGKTNMM